ncbi:ABC transporter permease subunit [Tateyamaria omphalii]|nr:ABC transporter permease subunit [Tateyamaria omphalii]
MAPTVTIVLLFGPILAGLIGTILPAFGGLRADGSNAFSVDPWRQLMVEPGVWTAIWLSIKTGVVSTLGALAGCFLLIAGWHDTRAFRMMERVLSPLLSVPHAAAALGLAFLVAPSGWLARLTTPWLTGWDRPPDLLILNDPGGWTLILGLLSKELPFLLLVSLAALPQIRAAQSMRVTQALGYGKVRGWVLAVMPSLYAQVRLPVYAVLAYAMSNVDIAVVLGPSRPPPLAVLVLQWMTDPDLGLRAQAAAAALVQLVLVVAAIAMWRCGERFAAGLATRAVESGDRGVGARDYASRGVGLGIAMLVGGIVFSGLFAQSVWSFAGRWRFPEALPDSFTLMAWARHGGSVLDVTLVTLALAFSTAFIALVLVIGCLETEIRRGKTVGKTALLTIYLPLILPQIAFLPGLQILLLHIGAARGIVPVVFAHVVFVLPYVFLTLAEPFRSLDSRYATLGATLGVSETGALWRIRLPLLLSPILTALAVGMAVSVGQYLATLLISGGRVSTLTTEALALFSGGDRRAIGVWTLALTGAAWLPFAIALVVPRLVYRNRGEMRHG